LPYEVNWDVKFGVWWAVGFTQWDTEYFGAAWDPRKRRWTFASWTSQETVGEARTVDQMADWCYNMKSD